jgi:transposase
MALDYWLTVAMEATIFSGWIYDYLLPHAAQIKVAHPLMLRAIAAAKKKNDQIDAARSPTACAATFFQSAT